MIGECNVMKVAFLSGFNNIHKYICTYIHMLYVNDFGSCLKMYEKYYGLYTDLFCAAYLQHHYIECNQSFTPGATQKKEFTINNCAARAKQQKKENKKNK